MCSLRQTPPNALQQVQSTCKGIIDTFVIDTLIAKLKANAMEVLGGDERLVNLILPYLIWNLDEECLQATGKNTKVAGSKSKRKHDNQNSSSRYFQKTLFVWPPRAR